MTEEKKEVGLGREIAREVAGDVCGLGAGVLVGGLALGAIECIPGIGKGLKILLKLGAYGMEIATMFKVKDAVGDYVDAVCDAVDSVKSMFEPKKEDVKVQVEGAVE